MIKNFEKISIRGRVAFAISCLENSIKFYSLEQLDWSFLVNKLWSYTNSNIGTWHYIMSEATPFGVVGQTDNVDDLEYLSVEEIKKLEILYINSNKVVNSIIDLIFDIGTRDLYASIVNNSPTTIKYLTEIIELLSDNQIPLPDIEKFKKFSISENEGWGNEFTKEMVFD